MKPFVIASAVKQSHLFSRAVLVRLLRFARKDRSIISNSKISNSKTDGAGLCPVSTIHRPLADCKG